MSPVWQCVSCVEALRPVSALNERQSGPQHAQPHCRLLAKTDGCEGSTWGTHQSQTGYTPQPLTLSSPACSAPVTTLHLSVSVWPLTDECHSLIIQENLYFLKILFLSYLVLQAGCGLSFSTNNTPCSDLALTRGVILSQALVPEQNACWVMHFYVLIILAIN